MILVQNVEGSVFHGAIKALEFGAQSSGFEITLFRLPLCVPAQDTFLVIAPWFEGHVQHVKLLVTTSHTLSDVKENHRLIKKSRGASRSDD